MNTKRNFNLFLFGNVISKFGDSVDLIAFMWLTYKITGSAALTGIVVAFNGLPAIILGLFSGIIADRYDKKKIMVRSDLLRAFIVVLVCALYMIHALNIFILIFSTLAISTLEILSTPARRAVLPVLIEKEQLLKANSQLSSGKLIAQLVGLSMAGLIINMFGLVTAVAIDAITFFISGVLIKAMEIPMVTREKTTISALLILKDTKKTMKILIGEWTILKTTVIATFVNLFVGPFNLLILQYCKNVLHNDSQGQSIINTINVIGVLLISYLFMKISSKLTCSKLISIGFFMLCFSYFLFSINRWMIPAMFITLIYGMGTGLISIPSVTLIQQDTPKEHLGKVLSVISLINESSVPLGNLVAGFLIEKLDIQVILFSFSIFMFVLIIILNCIFHFVIKRKLSNA